MSLQQIISFFILAYLTKILNLQTNVIALHNKAGCKTLKYINCIIVQIALYKINEWVSAADLWTYLATSLPQIL